MDIRDILKSFDQLTEGDSTVHKAGPGGYGNRHGTDDVTDQYGKPIGQMSLGKLGAQNEPKRGKGRPPNPDKPKSYDSSELNKAMGVGKAPKPTGKPSVKHSLKEYFNQMDEAGLSVQPMPATPQQKQQQAVATKPSFMIKDPANPNMPAITTQDPAVVQAAKNGTMSMQKPGAAPTAPGAAPAAGAGSQVAPMKETGDVGKHNNASTGFDALVRKLTPKYGKEAATKIAGSQFQKMKESEIEEAAKYRDPKYKDQLYTQEPLDHTFGPDMDDAYDNDYPDDYAGRKSPMHSGTGDPLEKWHRRSAKNSINTQGKRAGLPSRDQITSLKQSIKNVHGQHARPNLPEAEQPQHFAQSSPLSTANRGVLESKKGVNPFAKKDDKKDDKKKPDANKNGIPDYAEDGNGPNDTKKKGAAPKKGVNPFAKKTEKKKVKEGMEHHLQAARLEGKSHALRKMPYNCTHDNMEEARCYHDGFKEGLDECYGQMPILGRTRVGEVDEAYVASPSNQYDHYGDEASPEEHKAYQDEINLYKTPGAHPALASIGMGRAQDMNSRLIQTLQKRGKPVQQAFGENEVGTMASYGADDMGMDEGNPFTAGLARTPQGGKFKVGGNTFTDRTRYDSNLEEFAFESLDKQLNALLESEEKVSEGMTVSISKGQQGSPDSVSVSAQDGEADQLLSIIKSAGMGLFGGDEHNGYGAPQGSTQAPGGIEVVDDHDGMMALMRKLSGAGGEMPSGGDYESEEGHEGHGEEDHMHGEEETCNECGGMMEAGHSCGSKEMVDEVESEDQMEFEVSENAPDSGADNTNADVAGNAAANSALATADAGADEEEGQVYSSPTEGKEDTTGEEAGKEVKKDIEYDDKKDEKYKKDTKVDESYANSADDTFEADIDFMTKVISGGLNKQKSTGQTTVPVINGQKNRMGVDGLGSPMKESNDLLKDYRKLSGL